MEWFVLYVKSRHEFVTNGKLEEKGIETFLPSVKKWSHWKYRKKLIDFPLFPGYLFVHIYPNPEIFINILRTRGAVTFIYSDPGRPSPVTPEEINSLKRLIEAGEEIDVYPHLRVGTMVKVSRGPLEGAEGILEKKGEQFIFLVNIKRLGRSVGVKIHASDIEGI